MLKDILDTLDTVAKSIKNIQEIQKSVRTGVGYLKTKHPELKDDLKVMCEELQKTCHAIAASSSIITHFKFNGSPQAIQNEPTRFNEHYKEYKTNSSFAESQILTLKGSCSKIKQHIKKYEDVNTKKNIFSFLGLHNLRKEDELFEAIQKIYDDEMDFRNNVYLLGKSITDAVNHVSSSLENNHMMDYTLVPEAAKLLYEYSVQFSKLENMALQTKDDLDETINELNVA